MVDIVLDAWHLIRAENQFNDPPEPGTQFYMVTINVKNVGSDKKYFLDDLRTVGQSVGLVYTPFGDSCGVIPGDNSRDVLPGFSFNINVCWQVATADIPTLVMFWDELLNEDVWFSLQGTGLVQPKPENPPPTPRPTPTPANSDPLPPGNGDWTYFGPECPDGFGNCAQVYTQNQFISLDAYNDTNQSFYDDASIRISCWRNAPSLVFDGGGEWIGGVGRTGLNIRTTEQAIEEGIYFWTEDNDLEYVGFDRRESLNILALFEQAERLGKDVTMGVSGDYDTVVADFDVTGFTANFQRLPCS